MKIINSCFLSLVLLTIQNVYTQIIPPLPVNGWVFRGYSGNGTATASSYLSGVAYEGDYSQAFYISLPHGGATVEWIKNFEREFVKPSHIMYKCAYKSGNWPTQFDLKVHFYMKVGDSLYYFDASTVYKGSTVQWVSNSKSSYLGAVPNFSEIVLKLYFMPVTITNIDAWAEILLDELQLRYANGSIITIDRFGDPLTKFDESDIIPDQFCLYQNYPNPFNPTTVISFQLPISRFVTLKVYDVLGREVATLVNGEKSAGRHEVRFAFDDLSLSSGFFTKNTSSPNYSDEGWREYTSGVYFYRINAGNFSDTKKMIVVK